jgi:putative transposase
MCRVLEVAPSGYYNWLKQPVLNRAREDARLPRLIRASFVASQGIDGAPRVFLDLREAGEICSKHRVARLMRLNGLRALHGYRTRRWPVGKPSVLIPNVLQRQFTVTCRNKAWVTDITYIRTWQGWLYLAVVMDLFSRKVIGWSAGPTIHRELVLDAVLMAVRRRRPRGTIIHSDQGTQYGSDAWRRFCRTNHLEPSMSRKGNCWDNAVAESLFSSLKKERIKKHIYKTRELAVADVSDYIESFYNPTRRHSHPGGMSPDQFEAAHKAWAARYPLNPGNSTMRYRALRTDSVD